MRYLLPVLRGVEAITVVSGKLSVSKPVLEDAVLEATKLNHPVIFETFDVPDDRVLPNGGRNVHFPVLGDLRRVYNAMYCQCAVEMYGS